MARDLLLLGQQRPGQAEQVRTEGDHGDRRHANERQRDRCAGAPAPARTEQRKWDRERRGGLDRAGRHQRDAAAGSWPSRSQARRDDEQPDQGLVVGTRNGEDQHQRVEPVEGGGCAR